MTLDRYRKIGEEILNEKAAFALNEAIVTKDGTSYIAQLPVQKGNVTMRFKEISFSKQSVDCVVSIKLNVEEGSYPVFSQRVDLRSASARKSLATDLNAAYGSKREAGYNWVLILNIVFNQVIQNIKGEQKPTYGLGKEYEIIPFLLSPFLQANVSNIVFASSEVGKTWFSLSMAAAIATGIPFLNYQAPNGKKTLYLDYEDDFKTFINRLHKLCAGTDVPFDTIASKIAYYKPVGSFRNNVELIRDMVVEGGFDLIVVDAGGDAAGGSPSDEEKVLDLFNALDEVPCTRLIIHHEPKNVVNEDAAYFGSQYWKARSRVGWRLKMETRQHNDVLVKASLEKKSNLGFIEPFHFWLRLGDDAFFEMDGEVPPVRLERPAQEEITKLLRSITVTKDQQDMVLELLSEPLTIKEIEATTKIPYTTLFEMLKNLEKDHVVVKEKGAGRSYLWKRT